MLKKKTDPLQRRASGIILHISSLPSAYGIGDLGPGAFGFVDFLKKAGQTYWQVLPLNPTEPLFGNSPYSSVSAYAGNINFISPDLLAEEGLLGKDEVKRGAGFPSGYCDYGLAGSFKLRILNSAYEKFRSTGKDRNLFDKFCGENGCWLDDYALFVVLKGCFSGMPWYEWPAGLKNRRKPALGRVRREHSAELERVKFFQYLFFKQWFGLKRYCQKQGIRLIGDIPIYVCGDSVDVWSGPEFFKLDRQKKPVVVAGVPPDYFSETGQRWGNPVYNWTKLKGEKFRWWLRRLEHNFQLFDIVRMDHFRGFVACWEIPSGETTAVNGRWVKVPAKQFFSAVTERFPRPAIIAEDLGYITDDVRRIIREFGFPGMRVLIFAFSEDLLKHPYLPHNHSKNCVVYSGTHDNNTVRGWFESQATGEERQRICKYIGKKVNNKNINWEFIKLAMGSPANTAIFPMQDVLGLGGAARMNFPSKPQGNWTWRVSEKQLSVPTAKKLRIFTERSGRCKIGRRKPDGRRRAQGYRV